MNSFCLGYFPLLLPYCWLGPGIVPPDMEMRGGCDSQRPAHGYDPPPCCNPRMKGDILGMLHRVNR